MMFEFILFTNNIITILKVEKKTVFFPQLQLLLVVVIINFCKCSRNLSMTLTAKLVAIATTSDAKTSNLTPP